MELRMRHLIYPSNLYAMLEYVFLFTVCIFFSCPDGVIRMRRVGNSSGRKCTTSNNSIAHLFILFRFICKLWLMSRFKRLPRLAEVLENHKYLVYSDDNTGGHNLSFLGINIDQFISCKRETYAEFGMVLKPSQHYHSIGTGRLNPKHSFLGSSFHYWEAMDCYVPYPRMNYIASSLKFGEKKLPPEDLFAKVIALIILTCMEPKMFEELSSFLNFLRRKYSKIYNNLPESWLIMVKSCKDISMSWLLKSLGRESGKSMVDGGVIFNHILNMNKVARKEKILKNLGDKMGFSTEDVAWLTKSLDPFHDVPVQHLTGYPDGCNSNTVVQTIKKSFTVEKSTNLGTSSTWGFMLRMDDHLVKEDTTHSVLQNQLLIVGDDNVPYPQYGGISQVQFTSTTNLPLYTGRSGVAGVSNVIVDAPETSTSSNYIRGRSRCIARGFEIHNTTAEIYKQGTITSFQMPSTIDSLSVYEFGDGVTVPDEQEKIKSKSRKVTLPGNFTAIGQKSCRLVQAPPASVADAVILPGSLQWEAKDGAMMVQKQTTMENNMSYRDFTSVIILPDESLFPPDEFTDQVAVYVPTPDPIDSNPAYAVADKVSWAEGTNLPNDSATLLFQSNKRIPFNTMGVIVSGLNDQSTFTVNYIEVIERLPGWSEGDLIVLATPSPKRCDKIMRLYSLIVNELPTAVPVCENGFGDWFCGIVDSIVSTVSSIGRPLMGAAKGWTEARNEPAQQNTFVPPPKQIQQQQQQPRPQLQRQMTIKQQSLKPWHKDFVPVQREKTLQRQLTKTQVEQKILKGKAKKERAKLNRAKTLGNISRPVNFDL